MRNHIARDLHDDIGSTLSSINILSKVALQSPSTATPHDSLAKIRDRSAAIMEKMDDIVWTINPQNDTMEQLLYRMKEFAGEMLEPLNIDYRFEEAGELAAIKLDIRKRKDLYLVFKEAINNAAKYSQCSHLFIRLRQDGDSLRLEITDDGKGFAAGTARNGNGLNNMRERASSMLAKLSIESEVGQGTRIGLDLPIT
jgi:signal transduction histidine kinase